MTAEDYLPMCSRIFSLKEPCLHFLKFCFKQSKVRFSPKGPNALAFKHDQNIFLPYSCIFFGFCARISGPSVCMYIRLQPICLPSSVCLSGASLSCRCLRQLPVSLCR
jgi:hypothetical protein